MFQSWRDLLFLHWRLPREIVQRTLPPGLTVDEFEGAAWVGVVPFSMRNIRPRGLPAVPGVSNFLELNLRTYACDERGTPGVWFYTLDCNQPLAVWWARLRYHLPYFHAKLHSRARPSGAGWTYESTRRGRGPESTCRYAWSPGAARPAPAPGSLEFFLVERYLLFAADRRGRISSGRVWHTPYPTMDVVVEAADDGLLELGGLPRTGRPPDHAVFSPGVDVEVFALQPAGARE